MKRKICVITGSRAEYGLLKPLIEEIKKDKALNLFLIVTGMHLSKEYGLTYREIVKDGCRIYKKIDIKLASNTASGIARSMGLAMSGFANSYESLKPDIIVVLGDRFEIFSAVSAAVVSRIPVAHIGGGEVTEGSFDNSFRHAMTKMSHLHFTCTEEYRKRVIQLGEDPRRVFNTGVLGLDNIDNLKFLTKKEVEKKFNFKFNFRNLLVTFHPATLDAVPSSKQFEELLAALDELRDTKIFFTKANADTEGRVINRMIDKYVSNHADKAVVFASVGRMNYLSIMQFVDGVVGNSSSGITEAPSFKIGTINIGDRQKGRTKSESVIDCKPKKHNIKDCIKKMYSRRFQERLRFVINPYDKNGNAAREIKSILKNYNLRGILKKTFLDIDIKSGG